MRILCNAGAQYAWGWIERRLADPAPPTPGEIRALHSPKLEEFAHVLDDLLDSGPTKVVVFSQWERMVRLAEFVARGILAERGETSAIFHGGLNARARGRVLDAFREDPEVRVLYSTDAGGLGLNLQESASIVDPHPWFCINISFWILVINRLMLVPNYGEVNRLFSLCCWSRCHPRCRDR